MSHRNSDDFLQQGLRFECTGCGHCCTAEDDYAYIYLTETDRSEISEHLRLTPDEFHAAHCKKRGGGTVRLTMPNGACNFLKDNKCTVYPVRPHQCRAWPFWRENLDRETWDEEVRPRCPGVGRGRHYTKDEIRRIAAACDKAYGIDF